jgi:hypothetical protein
MRLVGIAVGLLIAALLLLAFWQHRAMASGLPPRVACLSPVDARLQAGPTSYEVLGTGSMAPYIPKAPAGSDPLKAVVAYAKPLSVTFKAIRKGDLVVYRPKWSNGLIIHQAAQKTGSGWIMSGLGNKQSESFEPITEKEFVAVIGAVYVW